MLWYGGFYGLFGIAILLNLLMFIFFKERSYLFCSLYQLSMVIYAMSQRDIIDVFLPAPPIKSWIYFHVVMIGAVAISSGMFTRVFLTTRTHTPRTDKLIQLYIASAVVMLLVTPLFNQSVLIDYTIVLGLLAPLITMLPGILRLFLSNARQSRAWTLKPVLDSSCFTLKLRWGVPKL